MDTRTYTYLLANPQEIAPQQMVELAGIIIRYPYFQSARALQLKGYKNTESFQYNDALKKTAAYTTDRDTLFSYITSKEFVQNSISEAILEHNKDWDTIDVTVEDVSQQVAKEQDIQQKEELKKAEAILNPDLFEKKKKETEIASMIKNAAETTNKTAAITPKIPKILNEISVPKIETSDKEEVSNITNPNTPLSFKKEDTHSFMEWLKLSQAKPIERTNEIVENKKNNPTFTTEKTQDSNKKTKDNKFKLIDKFIQEQPKIVPKDKSNAFQAAKIPKNDGPKTLMTETLASVYLQQGNHEKAIQAYKILILKYPEKSGFFADQIRAIQKLTKNK